MGTVERLTQEQWKLMGPGPCMHRYHLPWDKTDCMPDCPGRQENGVCLAELVQVRQHDLRQHGLHAERRQQAVEHRMCRGIVEPRQRFRELVLRRLDRAGAPLPGGRPLRLPCGLGGREPGGEVVLHRLDPRDVGLGIEAEAAARA